MPRDRSRGSNGTGDKEPRLEPAFLRAVDENHVSALEEMLATARASGQSTEVLLKIGLMKGAEKGKLNATIFLLKQGARTSGYANRVGPLTRAVERNHVGIVKVLLEETINPVDREEKDKKGRTPLMTAAWKNHYHILQLLMSRGADSNARDARGRTVLHNLAADKKCDWGEQVVHLLLNTDNQLVSVDTRDELERTPLHWCCTTGKRMLAEKLLRRHIAPRANVNAVERGQKTPLHLAVIHGRDDIVELLLSHSADVQATSAGGWTPLHNAAGQGSEVIVKMLLTAGADINSRLFNGRMPLHVAAEAGHVRVIETLLAEPRVRRVARDSFGFTSFLLAAQQKHRDCVNLLAPCNHTDALSHDALGASQGFSATVTDFGNYKNGNKVTRLSIYELLYARDPDNDRKAAFEALPTNVKPTNFRWIHLPANNVAWMEALMAKCFVEEGHHDVEGFKAIEKSFTYQHRGLKVHSRFMRPMCQTMPRAPRTMEDESSSGEGCTPRAVLQSVDTMRTGVSNDTSTIPSTVGSISELSNSLQNGDASKRKARKANTRPTIGKKVASKDGQIAPPRRTASDTHTPSKSKSPQSSAQTPGRQPQSNIFCFTPFLHFESSSARRQMQQAIHRAKQQISVEAQGEKMTCDEMLVRAHLTGSSTSLHVRRTLDQFFYHNIDTDSRDEDQVVYRYQYTHQASSHTCDPKIFMVDQLWLYVLGKDLVITAFPQRWNQPRNDPLDVLEGIIEDINSKTRDPIKSVYDVALAITARCTGIFDRHRTGDGDYQFLDMFESSIGNATDRETSLFSDFNRASQAASDWLLSHRKASRFSKDLEHTSRMNDPERWRHRSHREGGKAAHGDARSRSNPSAPPDPPTSHSEPMFVDQLLDIGNETDLLAESKDIRDEINMISKVLEDQKLILDDLCKSLCDICLESHSNQQYVKRRVRDQVRGLDMVLKDLERMDKQAARIYDSITNLLDLKQKHANALEARFARDQAAVTAKQSQTIMVFTIVTIVFLPLSFIAAFFTISIRDLPRDPDSGYALPMAFVLKYVFGIGLAISVPLVAVALSLDDIGDWWRRHVGVAKKGSFFFSSSSSSSFFFSFSFVRGRGAGGGGGGEEGEEEEGRGGAGTTRPDEAAAYGKGLEAGSVASAVSGWSRRGRDPAWQGGGHLLPVTSRGTAVSYRS